MGLIGLCLWLAGLQTALADNVPQIVLKMRPQVMGTINDGVILGEGYVVYHNNHIGFKVWSEAVKSTDQSNRYEITGKHGERSKIRIRLAGEGWVEDTETNQGITLMATDDVVKFFILSDGEQSVTPDLYSVQIHGVVLIS